jgi:hypothetical protein
MATNFDDFQKFSKEQLETVSTVSSSLAKGLQAIAGEARDYSQRSVETGSAYLQKLANAKTIEEALRIQSDYAKDAYEGFVAQTAKIGELYSNLAKDAVKPVQSVIAKAQSAAGSVRQEK